ncbi:MAG: hypothetical protein MK008_02950 [Bdellovibrionales bacterium]|nr:hypothetical protein [Bdellovibrionales bacterium]
MKNLLFACIGLLLTNIVFANANECTSFQGTYLNDETGSIQKIVQYDCNAITVEHENGAEYLQIDGIERIITSPINVSQNQFLKLEWIGDSIRSTTTKYASSQKINVESINGFVMSPSSEGISITPFSIDRKGIEFKGEPIEWINQN